MPISTRDLTRMPDIATLHRTLQSIAMLDAILASELGSDSDYKFNAQWRPGVDLAQWNNGCGDDFFAVFDAAGCWFKGFMHEAGIMTPFRFKPPRIWPGIFNGLPTPFAGYPQEPALDPIAITFCIWRLHEDTQWRRGNFELPLVAEDPDLSSDILSHFEWRPDDWADQEEANYERYDAPIDRELVRGIFAHVPLTQATVSQLAAGSNSKECLVQALRIGYPIHSSFKP